MHQPGATIVIVFRRDFKGCSRILKSTWSSWMMEHDNSTNSFRWRASINHWLDWKCNYLSGRFKGTNSTTCSSSSALICWMWLSLQLDNREEEKPKLIRSYWYCSEEIVTVNYNRRRTVYYIERCVGHFSSLTLDPCLLLTYSYVTSYCRQLHRFADVAVAAAAALIQPLFVWSALKVKTIK